MSRWLHVEKLPSADARIPKNETNDALVSRLIEYVLNQSFSLNVSNRTGRGTRSTKGRPTDVWRLNSSTTTSELGRLKVWWHGIVAGNVPELSGAFYWFPVVARRQTVEDRLRSMHGLRRIPISPNSDQLWNEKPGWDRVIPLDNSGQPTQWLDQNARARTSKMRMAHRELSQTIGMSDPDSTKNATKNCIKGVGHDGPIKKLLRQPLKYQYL